STHSSLREPLTCSLHTLSLHDALPICDSGLAIIPAPRLLPRIIRVPEEVGGAGANHVFLSSMIHAHADDLFHAMKVKVCYQFRLTRNADLSVDTEDVEYLARALRGELLSRRYGDAVR